MAWFETKIFRLKFCRSVQTTREATTAGTVQRGSTATQTLEVANPVLVPRWSRTSPSAVTCARDRSCTAPVAQATPASFVTGLTFAYFTWFHFKDTLSISFHMAHFKDIWLVGHMKDFYYLLRSKSFETATFLDIFCFYHPNISLPYFYLVRLLLTSLLLFIHRCSYGWFGYPRQAGGSCAACECDPHGSVSDECHEETGQCNCRPGITGRDCSQCQTRHILTEHGCSSKCSDVDPEVKTH